MKGYQIDRKAELAMIHIGAKELGIRDDDGNEKTGELSTYQQMLFTLTRKTSSADLDHTERRAVINHLKARGWKPKQSRNRPQKPPQFASDDQIGLLTHIWICLANDGEVRNRSNSALLQWANGQTKKINKGAVYASLEGLPKWLAEKLIENLKNWANRKNVEWRNPY